VSRSRLFVDLTPLRRFPQFRRLWVGYAIRQIGAQLTVTTVIYQVFALTHSNLDVGLIALVQLGPAIFAPIVGGAIADAVDRRKLLIATALLLAASTVGLALNAMSGRAALWPLFVCSAIIWGLAGVDGPTRTTVIMSLVDRDSFVGANILRQLLQQISLVVGPALAGLLIALFAHHLAVVYWIDVASTLAALQAVIRLPPLLPHGGGRKFGLASIVEGLSFLKGRQEIQACFIADLNAMVLGMPTSLFPYMATEHFHGGSKAYGLLTAAPGIGAVLGGLVSGWAHRVRRQGLAVLVAITIWGLAIAGFGVAPWLGLGVALLVVAGWADVISATFRNTIVQVQTPDALRGRLSALQSAVVQGGPSLGNAEAGIVAALSSAPISVVSGGLGCVVGIALIAKLMPRFATFELPSADEDSETPGNPTLPAGLAQQPPGTSA
jgi:MFS family permease